MSVESASDPAEDLPFEAALVRLEALVDRLEQTDLDLEAALAAFEEGVRLSARCASQLEAAEQRIEVLMEEGGRLSARPFEPAADAPGDEAPEGS